MNRRAFLQIFAIWSLLERILKFFRRNIPQPVHLASGPYRPANVTSDNPFVYPPRRLRMPGPSSGKSLETAAEVARIARGINP